MPGVRSIDVYTAGFSPYVIVQFNGRAGWRQEQVARGTGWNSNPGARTAENGVSVLFQSHPGLDPTATGDVAGWEQKLRGDARYQNAVRILTNARYSDYRWQEARAFIFGDDFVASVYRKEPNARFDTPPREPSAFRPCR